MTDPKSDMKDFREAKRVGDTLVTLRTELDLAGSRPGDLTNVWLTKYQIGLLLSLVEQALE